MVGGSPRADRARLDAGEMRGVMGEAAGCPELAIADAVDPSLDLLPHRRRNGWRDLCGDGRGSMTSAFASRAGMSSHPLGGDNRPTCEVLIRVMLFCISLFSP